MTLQEIINDSESIVFFGGAGVSTESGIPDFRSTDGLYNQKYDFPPETILSHRYFVTHTADFYKFYRDKMIYSDAKPNKAHIALAKLEQSGKLKAIITQNIDNLHQKAGSKTVYELHGSVYRNYCMDCGKSYNLDAITNCTDIPRCDCGGIIKPDVVLYEENLNEDVINGAINAISNCDTLIIAGTSLTVYPAAGFVGYFKGRHLVLINRDKTSYDKYAELVLREKVGEVLGEIVVE